MPKRSKNLSLDVEAIRRAEWYSRMHGTSVSALVSNYLLSLPVEPEGAPQLPPSVRRLLGAAAGEGGVEAYHEHLAERYGR